MEEMNKTEVSTGGFIIGILIGAIFISAFLTHCDRVNPIHSDSTQIYMVENGFAHWEVDSKGKSIFVVDSLNQECIK